ncbi:AmmeMemoRadiSam system radical SAM enzyme [Calderihabitans maritimus]|uniref:Radical SAM family protein n=1 Tax=Calderihabitans maritimus TaxID=1246530 RepID=A0A1Z5HN24_9FIRM|nr:AmmeMemoRadiSam system radical SAM enzyme [Calderihabitans maritimus]GAW90868.1 radical SAM family protein [Calderihabitans maritimus]
MREAEYYETLAEETVRCQLCPHRCTIRPGQTGICRVRENREGRLYSLNYGRCSSYALDPIEKKPLYHFYPGSYIFSIGTVGCNFHCEFCQNWGIAHGNPETLSVTPEQLVKIARERQRDENCVGIAYTYSEPLVWYEFVRDTAKLARQAGLKNVLVTNGFINRAPLQELLPYIDALNIDVKGFSNEFYRKVVHGAYKPVLETAEEAKARGCHVEITTLLVPGLNDDEEEIKGLVDWVATALGEEVPLHFSRYFPSYKMSLEPTPLETLRGARDLAREKLLYVYIGNAWELGENDTYCPNCGWKVIERSYYAVRIVGLNGRQCARCGKEINVII